MPTLQDTHHLPTAAPSQTNTPYPIPGAPDLIMGDMAVYGYGAPYPLVDHPHERTHQHQTFWRYLQHQKPDQKLYPNYPDVDIRDATTEYLIEIEVPGVKDSSEITCQWTSMKSLVVTGTVTRPAWKSDKGAGKATATDDSGDSKPSESPEPYLLVGERKIGAFRRNFYFPVEMDMEKLSAKLEAGLLRLRVPKHGQAIPKGDSKVNIEVQD